MCHSLTLQPKFCKLCVICLCFVYHLPHHS